MKFYFQKIILYYYIICINANDINCTNLSEYILDSNTTECTNKKKHISFGVTFVLLILLGLPLLCFLMYLIYGCLRQIFIDLKSCFIDCFNCCIICYRNYYEKKILEKKKLKSISTILNKSFVNTQYVKNETCTICLDDFSNKKIIKLKCNHVYHYDCILPWLEENNNCPLCRDQFNKE